MKKIIALFLLIFIIGIIQIHAQDEEEKSPVKWILKVDKSDRVLEKEETFKAVLDAEIQTGWHLYALEKIEGGPIPTRITLGEQPAFELGEIEFSKPIELDDPAFGVTTKFYEDSAKFILPIKVLEKFDFKTSNLKIKVRYQLCSNQICLAPKTVLVESNSAEQ